MLKRKNLKKRKNILKALDHYDLEVFQDESSAEDVNHNGSFFEDFEASLSQNPIRIGDVVKGKILDIKEDHVLVEVNYKSEGLVSISEFADHQVGQELSELGVDEAFRDEGSGHNFQTRRQNFRKKRNYKNSSYSSPLSFNNRPFLNQKRSEILKNIQLGSEVEVYVDRMEDENGRIVLSKGKADLLRVWNKIAHASESGEPIDGTVFAKVKGGLSIDVGLKAFLPGSQIDVRPVRDTSHYVGKTYQFKVIKFNKKRGNVVLSRRAILENERNAIRSQAFDSLKEGEVIKGFVKSIMDYGAFIDLGGMDGLLHITDMSWSRIKHPSEVIQEGEEIDVVVLKFDSEKKRVSLGLKQLKEDPWKRVTETYPLGDKVKGKIISITDYGAFVKLDEGIEGLIHISEMSWIKKKFKHPSQVVKVGEEVDVQVLEIDSRNRKISLGLKQLMPNPWDEIRNKYKSGTVLDGEVRSVTAFGIFVNVNENVDGLVHISDFSWTRRINHPSKEYKVGDKLKVVVLDVDTKLERFSLGVKQLEPNPWAEVETRYPIGSRHKVKVIESTDFGVFVELEKGIDGLVHISELSTKRIEKTDDVVKVGETIEAEIMSIDKKLRKIGLSVKALQLREKKEGASHHSSGQNKEEQAFSKTSLGDMFGSQLKGLGVSKGKEGDLKNTSKNNTSKNGKSEKKLEASKKEELEADKKEGLETGDALAEDQIKEEDKK